jgi:hypothetical protein
MDVRKLELNKKHLHKLIILKDLCHTFNNLSTLVRSEQGNYVVRGQRWGGHLYFPIHISVPFPLYTMCVLYLIKMNQQH